MSRMTEKTCRFFHDWHVTFPPYKSAKRTCQRCGKVDLRYPEYNKWVGCMLNFERQTDERIAILEMLLWKYHTKSIPKDVADRLIENGFMEETSKGAFRWTGLSNEIAKEFNSKFNYA